MRREEVESSVLKSVGYDKNKEILEAEIVTGEIYEYYTVPLSEYDTLMNAESKGEYYNKTIKKHRYSRIR